MRRNTCGRDGRTEGSTRGPRRPKKVLLFLQAPLTRIESGLSPKDANELLLNEVAVGDVYPNALGKLGKAGRVEH